MCRAPSTAIDASLWRGVDLGSSLTACKLKKVILCAMIFCCAPGPHPVRSIFLMRQAPDGSSREERQASGPWHHPSGSGRPARQTKDTATASVGAGPWHGQKWSPEAENGHAGCQKGRLDRSTESHPSEQNDTMRSHGTFLHLHIAFTGFASGAAPPKTVSRG